MEYSISNELFSTCLDGGPGFNSTSPDSSSVKLIFKYDKNNSRETSYGYSIWLFLKAKTKVNVQVLAIFGLSKLWDLGKAKVKNTKSATNGAGLRIRLSPWLDRELPIKSDFAIDFKFLWAV